MQLCIYNAKLHGIKTPYLKRSLEPVLDCAAKDFPVVVLTGPRQSGKTTVLKHLFGRMHHYVSFETAVLTEIIKTFVHRGEEPEVYFWRTSTGSEVDFVIHVNGKLIPIEVELSATLHPSMAGSILVLWGFLSVNGKRVKYRF